MEEGQLLDVVRGFDEDVDVDVALMQHKLRLVYGENVCALDGHYGPRTAGAVEIFLRDHALPIHSATDKQSRSRLLTPVAAAVLRQDYLSELESNALKSASSDAVDVHSATDEEFARMLQLSLNEVMGREVCKPDGVYGVRTRKALQDFQELFGLPISGDLEEQLKVVSQVLRNEAPRRRGQLRRELSDFEPPVVAAALGSKGR